MNVFNDDDLLPPPALIRTRAMDNMFSYYIEEAIRRNILPANVCNDFRSQEPKNLNSDDNLLCNEDNNTIKTYIIECLPFLAIHLR